MGCCYSIPLRVHVLARIAQALTGRSRHTYLILEARPSFRALYVLG